MIKKRNKACNSYRQFTSSYNFNRYKRLNKRSRNRVCKRIKQDKFDYQHNLIEKFKDHPKLFYGYMRNANTVKSKVSNITKLDGTLTKHECGVASCCATISAVPLYAKYALIALTLLKTRNL